MNFLYLLYGTILGYILTAFYEQGFKLIHLRRGRMPILRLWGYHFHHSLYGLFLVIISFFIDNLFLAGLGLGIIIRHTDHEHRFVFIDRS